MKQVWNFIIKAMLSGVLVIVPIYLALLLLLKGMSTVLGLVRPWAKVLPEWLPAEQTLSLILVLLICFLIGVTVRTRLGRSARNRIERTFFERVPGYATFRSLTQRAVGDTHENAWMPALAEIEEALVPAFIVEELADGRYTVFVPSVPTPFAGAVYILPRQRVHPLELPFTHALKVISRWGSGSAELVAAMKPAAAPAAAVPG